MTATIEVFDHAMCCSTGVCGLTVNPELAPLRGRSALLVWLPGSQRLRYNLAAEPGEFAARPVVAAMLRSSGRDVLPIVWSPGSSAAAAPGLRAPTSPPPWASGFRRWAPTLAPAENACCNPTEQATSGAASSRIRPPSGAARQPTGRMHRRPPGRVVVDCVRAARALACRATASRSTLAAAESTSRRDVFTIGALVRRSWSYAAPKRLRR